MDTTHLHHLSLIVIFVFLGPMLVIEICTGKFFDRKATLRDSLVETSTSTLILLVIYPGSLLISAYLVHVCFPNLE